MAYNRHTLYTEHRSYIEVKTIKGRQYRYRRTVVTNGGSLTRRSEYLGPVARKRK